VDGCKPLPMRLTACAAGAHSRYTISFVPGVVLNPNVSYPFEKAAREPSTATMAALVSVNFFHRSGAHTRPLLSSTPAVLVTPPRVPLSNRLRENHAPNVSHKRCLR